MTEQQSAAVSRVVNDRRSATHALPPCDLATNRKPRHLGVWLRETLDAASQLCDMFRGALDASSDGDEDDSSDQRDPAPTREALATLRSDREVMSGMRVLVRLAEGLRLTLSAHVTRLVANNVPNEESEIPRGRAKALRAALFSSAPSSPSYAVLEALQALQVFIAHINSLLVALTPASQALWDAEFQSSVSHAQELVGRMQAWVQQQVKVRSPQTLLVPELKNL